MKHLFIFTLFMALIVYKSSASVPPGLSIITPSSVEDTSELKVVSQLFKNKTVIGLGENVHGTHAPHALRFRLIKYLVEEENFRLIAFEAPWSMARTTSDYVTNCTGDVNTAQGSLYFAAWADASITSLLEFLCKFNKSHPNDKVSLVGIDMQDTIRDKSFVREYLKIVDEKMADQFKDSVDNCLDSTASKNPSKEKMEACVQALSTIQTQAIARKTELERKTSPLQFMYFKLALQSLKAMQTEMYAYAQNDYKASYDARDYTMAQNFELHKTIFPKNIKSIIYAHNGHITKEPQRGVGARTLGSVLASLYKDKYASMASLSFETKVNQELFKGWSIESPAPYGTLEFSLHQLNLGSFLLDTHSKNIDQNTDYYMLDSGAVNKVNLSKAYDLIYFTPFSGELVLP